MPTKRIPLIVSIVLAVLGLAWILVMGKVFFGGLFFVASGGFFEHAKAIGGDAQAWTRPRVLVAGFFGIVAALVLFGIGPGVPARFQDLARENARLESAKKTLEMMDYDADGNVPRERSSAFSTAMSQSKYLPQSLAATRENLVIALALTAGALLVLVGCGLVIDLTVRRRVPLATAGIAVMRA